MKDTYLNKAITIFTAFLALSLCLLFTDAHASASEVDPSQATWVDPQVCQFSINGLDTEESNVRENC